MKAALLAALFVVFGCGKSKDAEDPDLVRVREMRDGACRCKDLACIRAVSQEFQKGGEPKNRSKEFDALLDEAGRCAQEIAGIPDEAGGPAPAHPGKPHADAVIAAGRAWRDQHHRARSFALVRVDYVEANGTLDATHGKIEIALGAEGDHAGRKTGAPVTKDAECPFATFEKNRWSTRQGLCVGLYAAEVKCTVETVWARAVADARAPAEALARLTFSVGTDPSWSFEIKDEPRKIDIAHVVRDDCEPVVESAR